MKSTPQNLRRRLECLQKESAKVGSFFDFIEEKENVEKCGKIRSYTTVKSAESHKILCIFTKYTDLTRVKHSDNMQMRTEKHTNKQKKNVIVKMEGRKWQKQML